MPRPKRCRRIESSPYSCYFKPQGIPLYTLEEVNITMDEFEAIRLADLNELYHEDAAKKMNISRPTFSRLIESAHKKIAKAIVEGKALKIEGGVYEMVGLRKFRCSDCSQLWELPHGTGRPMDCPQCKSKNIHRADEDKGHSRMGKETACRGRYGRGNPPQNRKQ